MYPRDRREERLHHEDAIKKFFDYVITDVTRGKGKKAASPQIWRST
jgi:hypothetical protein